MAEKNGVLIFFNTLIGVFALFFAIALYSLKDRQITLGTEPSLDVVVTER